ncbi:entericidin A/B family lipoprotein [Vreelandella nigrificans]|uniref:Entericidin n=1 Tax=Vreelandella nigrificans TaxID=2042704 RepID=A0A2A4HNV1_9GAMM|nr:entericidin A/B family lipoprotein [Halomonas nigrificans]PCF96592.1 entericidin [Halomonas nigrificans]
MKRTLLLCVLLMATLIAISGCNTVRGMGQDIEKGGEAIQRTADS